MKDFKSFYLLTENKEENIILKAISSGALYDTIKQMSEDGSLKEVLPEVDALKGVVQNPTHHSEGDAFVHTLMVLKNAKSGIVNQLSALLHDVGKAVTTEDKEGKITSYGHDEAGAKIAEEILIRLGVDEGIKNKVVKIVSLHMRPHFLRSPSGGGKATSKMLRKFVKEAGEELEEILDLGRADETGKIPPTNDIPEIRERIKELLAVPEKKKPILDGREVMELLGIKSGTEVGKAVKIVADLEDEYGDELTKEFAKEELKKRFVTESIRIANNLLQE